MASEKIQAVVKVTTDSKQAENQAKKIGQNIGKNVESGTKKIKFGDAIKGQLQKVKQGIQAVGISGEKLSKIGDFFRGGYIAAFAAAIMLAAKAIKTMWDNANESAEEYKKRMESNQRFFDESIKKSQQDENLTRTWFDRLKEINKMEKISNSHKAEALMLIRELTERYGDLGIEIDKQTGKLNGLHQAQMRVADLNYQTQLKNREKQVDLILGTGGSAHRAAARVIEKLSVSIGRGANFMQPMLNGTYKTTEQAKNMGLDVVFSTNNKRNLLSGINGKFAGEETVDDTEISAIKKWNDGGFQGKLQWVQYMRNHKDYKGNSDFQQALDQLEKQLKDAMDKQKEYKSFKYLGKPSVRAFTSQIATTQKHIDRVNQQSVKQQKQEEQRRQTLNYANMTTREKIQYQKKRQTEETEKISSADAELKKLSAEYQQAETDLLPLMKKREGLSLDNPQYGQLSKQILSDQKKLAELAEKRAETAAKLQVALTAEMTAKNEENRLQQQLINRTEKQIALQEKIKKLKLQGRFEQAKQLEKQAKFEQSFGKMGIDILKQINGDSLESQYKQKIQQLEKTIGGELSAEQKENLYEMVKIKFNLENLPEIDSYRVDTNQLTRRGGFKTGYVSNAEQISRQIEQNTKQQVNLTKQLKMIVQGATKI